MTHNELILAEYEARKRGDINEAGRLQALRWEGAMSAIVNSENARGKPSLCPECGQRTCPACETMWRAAEQDHASGDPVAAAVERFARRLNELAAVMPCGQPSCGETQACARADCPIEMLEVAVTPSGGWAFSRWRRR